MKFFSPAAPHRHPCLTLHSWNWRKRKNCSLHFLSTQDAKFLFTVNILYGLPRWHRAKKNPPANAGGMGSNPGLARFPWSKKWQPTPAFLPGESHGQRSLPDYSPWGCKESNTTECTCAHTRTHTHTHIDTIIYEISAKFGIRKLELFNEILTRLMKIYRETVIKHYIHVGYNQ